eukprot:scaffold23476_cov53-Attheya_sp.AAC.3
MFRQMSRMSRLAVMVLLAVSVHSGYAWQAHVSPRHATYRVASVRTVALHMATEQNDVETSTTTSSTDDDIVNNVEETTEKYGLEAGLFQSFKSEDGGESAKSLLQKYGIAYLATSIPLALVSFTICYALVDAGVDVAALLDKVGIQTDWGEKAGTVAIAYAAHKAASPIRFPPTVLLTPVVAKLIGKEPTEEEPNNEEEPTP